MRAAVLTPYEEPLEIQDVDRPEPAPDGVVASVEARGGCRSDWHGWQGNWEGSDYETVVARSSTGSRNR